jgi:hypothetical protein
MADTPTKVPLATTTLSSAGTGVTFSSISADYTDLKLVISGAGATANITPRFRFNSNTATTYYSFTTLTGDGTTAASTRSSNSGYLTLPAWVTTASTGVVILDIFSYSNSTTYKTCLMTQGSATTSAARYVGMYRQTAAINTIYVSASSNYAAGTTFTLYGIL